MNGNLSSGSKRARRNAILTWVGAALLTVTLLVVAAFYAFESRREAEMLRAQHRLVEWILSAGSAAHQLEQERFLALSLISDRNATGIDAFRSQARRVEHEVAALRALNVSPVAGESSAASSALAQVWKSLSAIEPRRASLALNAESFEAVDRAYTAAVQSLLDAIHQAAAGIRHKALQEQADAYGNLQQAAELAARESILLLGWTSGRKPDPAAYAALVSRQDLYLGIPESSSNRRAQDRHPAEMPAQLVSELAEARAAIVTSLRRGVQRPAESNAWLQVQTAYAAALAGIGRESGERLRNAAARLAAEASTLEYNSALGVGLALLLALLVLVRIARAETLNATPAPVQEAEPPVDRRLAEVPRPTAAVPHLSVVGGRAARPATSGTPSRSRRTAGHAADVSGALASALPSPAAHFDLMRRLREAADSFRDAQRCLEHARGAGK